ncbi:unnamed protein product [Cuscuta epithymum]|uniref:Uncharacterized protein n=1 Tax=Cuscuta epithymum TaxID=186058 RepID=A0AAV0FHM2_9ASTE|nr:unnamed protein product [Cuscuta epithymum]CAH9134933.1 unnamed protein product [Cuscuta epithymum]
MAAQSFKLYRLNTFSNPHLRSLLSPKSRNGIAWRRMLNSYSSSVGSEIELDVGHNHPDFEYDEIISNNNAKVLAKDTALRSALSHLACDNGTESMLSLHRFFGARCAHVISTGSINLDQALGIGGLPKGRIVEIYGQEASGKTTLALHVIKEAQKLGGYCAYLDVENAMDPLLAEAIGVNTSNLLISQPDSAENLLSVVDTLTKCASVDVIVVDSVAALIPQLEIDACIGDSFKDVQSKIMTRALRKIHYSLCNSSALIIFINQVRSKVQQPSKSFGCAEEVTCGGNALPFYAAVRLRLIRKELLKANDTITGLGISVQVVKNKLAHGANSNAELRLKFGRGICNEIEALELGCEHGVILQEGNGYFIEGEVLNSKEEAEAYLAENGAVLDSVIKSLRAHLFRRRGGSL